MPYVYAVYRVSASSLKFCSFARGTMRLDNERCLSLSRPECHVLCSPRLFSARTKSTGSPLGALCNFPQSFPVAGHYAADWPDSLPSSPASSFRKGTRIHGINSFVVYERPLRICFPFYCPRYYLKRFQVAHQSVVVASFERIITMVKRRRASNDARISRYPLRMCAARKNRRSCAYVVLTGHVSR